MSRAGSAIRDERGMTIIELMVAMLICVVGIMTTIALIDRSRTVSTRAEAREAMTVQADREIERILALPWDQIAHQSIPADSGPADPADPQSWITTGVPSLFWFDQDATSRGESMKQLPTGQVPSTPTPWNDNQSRLSGRVYTFVTEPNDTTRRVTVVATVTGSDKPPPVIVSSIVTNPVP